MSLTARILAILLFAISATPTTAASPPGSSGAAAGEAPPWPARVLITNDDGIEDESRLVTLAAAFHAAGAEVTVAVPRENRSGTNHRLTLLVSESQIRVERLARHETSNGGPTKAFYVVDGFPADCVLFALAGPMIDAPPDLVVSGINGGANLAEAWLGSGTIGAARIAAYAGIPAIAVSGIDEEAPGAAGPLAAWIAKLAASKAVRQLEPGSYLTIALPPRPLTELAGVRIARRSPMRIRPVLTARGGPAPAEGGEIWEISDAVPMEIPADSDSPLYDQGYVVITPMRANEDDLALLERLRRDPAAFPALPD